MGPLTKAKSKLGVRTWPQHMGRKRKLTELEVRVCQHAYQAKDATVRELAWVYGITATSLYKYLTVKPYLPTSRWDTRVLALRAEGKTIRQISVELCLSTSIVYKRLKVHGKCRARKPRQQDSLQPSCNLGSSLQC